ncbi:LysE family translocator [Peribacillus acanthi]|uniref:LysE family translocator n=1 Tax=Peribacillus acanthi TaxID=2171554 RepID=UPI000D3E2042|nr:LysE family translocator [Peribacillus acanthi]
MENYFLFILSLVCLLLIPGPDTALVLTNTMNHGKKGGVMTVLGICCALIAHIILAVIGLSSMLERSVFWFNIIKFSGAIYLIYIGINSLAALRRKSKVDYSTSLSKDDHCFRQGLLSNLLNPKVVLFFLSFLPQFINAASNHMGQFLILGFTHLLLTIVFFSIYIAIIDKYSHVMTPTAYRIINSVTGILLMVFGIKLAIFRE